MSKMIQLGLKIEATRVIDLEFPCKKDFESNLLGAVDLGADVGRTQTRVAAAVQSVEEAADRRGGGAGGDAAGGGGGGSRGADGRRRRRRTPHHRVVEVGHAAPQQLLFGRSGACTHQKLDPSTHRPHRSHRSHRPHRPHRPRRPPHSAYCWSFGRFFWLCC